MIRITSVGAPAGIALLLLASGRADAALVVDDFTQGGFSLTDTTTTNSVDDNDAGLGTSSVIGGSRLTQLSLFGGTQASASLSGGAASFQLAAGSEGQLALGYGNGGGGPFNLAAGGDRFRVVITGAPARGTIGGFVMVGGSAYVAGVDFASAGTYDLPFNSFAPLSGSGTPNFAGVDSIGFNFTKLGTTGGAVSYAVQDISVVPAPEPAGLAAMAAAGLLAMSRRRRRPA